MPGDEGRARVSARVGRAAVLFLVLGAGCRDTAVPADRVTRRDSAGVEVVESRSPAWRDGAAWQVEPAAELTLGATGAGGGNAEALFTRVGDVEVLADGRVAVVDWGTAEVFVFTPEGRLAFVLGGEGAGPGQFRRVEEVYGCDDGSVAVDGRPTLDLFDVDGEFVRRLPYQSGDVRWDVFGLSSDCRRLLLRRSVDRPELNRYGASRTLVVARDTAPGRLDTVGRFTTGEGVTFPTDLGGSRLVAPPWSPSTWTMTYEYDIFVVGYARRPEVQVYGLDGALHRIFRWNQPPLPVTSDDRKRYEDARRRFLRVNEGIPGIEHYLPELDFFPEVPSEKPYFDRIVLDDHGHVWLRRVSPNSLGTADEFAGIEPEGPERWTVVDPTGQWLGELEMPPDFALHTVSRGRLYGVVTGRLDVPTVQVFRIEGTPTRAATTATP